MDAYGCEAQFRRCGLNPYARHRVEQPGDVARVHQHHLLDPAAVGHLDRHRLIFLGKSGSRGRHDCRLFRRHTGLRMGWISAQRAQAEHQTDIEQRARDETKWQPTGGVVALQCSAGME